MVRFVSDDDRNHTRSFLAFVHGKLTDPDLVRIEFDDPRFRYQIAAEICSLLDDGTLATASHIRILSTVLSSDQVSMLYRATRDMSEALEETWRPAFEKAFASHTQALPPPLPLPLPRDVGAAAKAGDIEKVLRLIDAAEMHHASLAADDYETVVSLAEEAGHPELAAILDQEDTIWGDETPLEIVRNAARDGVAQAQIDLAWRLMNTDQRAALKWAERAAAQYHPRACAILGAWLHIGIGVPSNHAAAQRCFERSAELSDPEGMYQLAEMHRFNQPPDHTAAFFWLTEAEQLGHVGAKVSLGHLYEYGDGVEPDPKRAFRLYSEAAARDEELGVLELARCHEEGIGTPRNLELAFRHFQQAANLGFEDAYRSMGWAYANGLGVEKNRDKAIDAYERAIALGSAGAASALGALHLNNGAPAEALRCFRKAEELGHEDISHWIALALKALGGDAAATREPRTSSDRRGVIREEEQLAEVDVEATRRAAEAGDAKSMLTLGLCYVRGAGVAKDRATGLSWLRRAADSPNDVAITALADELSEEQPEEAARLYERAAIHGHPEAQFGWAQCLDYGDGTAQDEKAALSWYRRAAGGGLAGAQHRLGVLYLNGSHGLPVDEREGVKLLKLGAEKWHDGAMEDLAAWYLSRPDATPEMDREAVALLKQTIGFGSGEALQHLAFCYLTARGVEKDLDEAERLFRKALELGAEAGHAKLANLYFDRDEYDKAIAQLDQGIAEEEVDSIVMRAVYALQPRESDPGLAVRLLEKALELDPEEAQARLLLADCVLEGNGIAKSVSKALRMYTAIADGGDARAYAAIARIHEDRGQHARALEWLNRGVREEDADCMVLLAHRWLDSKPPKEEWAVQLLRKAAKLEHDEAILLLGYCLGFGRGGNDLEEAERLLTHESLVDDGSAVTYLMFLALDRRRDVPKAVELARRGAELESSDCMTMLGVAYELGLSVPKNFQEAIRWYERALKLGDLGAMLHLARISLDAARPFYDDARAFSLLQRASKHDDAADPYVMIAAIPNPIGNLWYQIGRCWELGLGTPANLVKAIVNYRKAEKAGSKEAAAAIARLEAQ